MGTPRLMVLGGETRAALGIVRSLGAKGVPLVVGGCGRFAPAMYSRFVHDRFTYPVEQAGLEARHEAVMAALRRFRPDVLLPVMDDTWVVVYDRFDDYRRYTSVVPCPGPDLYSRLSDKRYLTRRAEECGVPTPRSYLPDSPEEAAALRERLPYPVLLKPPRSTTGAGIRQVHDPNEFMRVLEAAAVVPLIQECVPGEDLDLSVLCVNGEVLAHCAYEMVRSYPMPYGPPIASRTIPDEGMLEPARRLLRSVGYHGPANLDFRRDARDGVPRLLDFNARLAGTNEISVRSGVDFPHLLYRLALGHVVDPVTSYRMGLEFRWLMFGEVRHFLQTERKAETARALMKWRDVAINLSPADPLPHVAHCLDALLALASPVRTVLGRRGRT